MRIAVLAALKKEIAGIVKETGLSRPFEPCPTFPFIEGSFRGHRLLVGRTGAGKVLAAAATQAVCLSFSPEAVLLCGTAGSLSRSAPPLNVVVARKALAHDADPAVARWHHTDSRLVEDLAATCRELRLDESLNVGAIVTGDQPVFCGEKRRELAARFDAVAVDMEAAAVVQVAELNRVPVAVVKAVTDHADRQAESDFRRNLKPAVKRVQEVVLHFLAHLQD